MYETFREGNFAADCKLNRSCCSILVTVVIKLFLHRKIVVEPSNKFLPRLTLPFNAARSTGEI